MLQIALSLKNYAPEKTTCKSERAELIKQFVDAINLERADCKWRYKVGEKWKKLKPVTGRGIAIRCSHVDMYDLRYFYSECKQARSFSEYFFGRLKKKQPVDSKVAHIHR